MNKFNFDLTVDSLERNVFFNSIAYLSNDYTSLKVFFERCDNEVIVREADVFAVLYTDGTDESDILTTVKYNKELHFAIERTISAYFKKD